MDVRMGLSNSGVAATNLHKLKGQYHSTYCYHGELTLDAEFGRY